MGEPVRVCEVGPRDGLQNEARAIATADKVALVDRLAATGLDYIEVTSFVSSRAIPQMADAAEVMAGIARRPGVTHAVLVPNLKGLAAAQAAGADEAAVFASASEGFSRANINCSVDESLDRFAPVAEAALEAGLPLRGYVSCVTDCPYDGPVAPAQVARVAAALWRLGCREVSLGDTIGAGTPQTVAAMLAAVAAEVPVDRLAGHFHDTGGRALDNIAAALEAGVRVFDAAAGCLGGCPFAPGAAGNVATEVVVDFLEGQGMVTGVDRDALAEAAGFARGLRGPR